MVEENRLANTCLDNNDALPPGIVVMGSYRCGTSFLSHVLSGRGVNFGPAHELYAADEWNPHGYFQRPDVLQANNAFVASSGYSAFAPPDLATLRTLGDTKLLSQANLDWRYGKDIWGIKDPRFSTTLMSWFETGLLGNNTGLIRIHREPLDSARSLLNHPELAAQLCNASLETALQLSLRYDQLAEEQQRCFLGPSLELVFEEFTSNTSQYISVLDEFIDSLKNFG